jgi:hypothetical protein
MTDANLKNQLANDPGFAIGIILANNPEEVVDRLHGIGYRVSSADDCWAAIKDLIAKGDTKNLKYCLSVPFIGERADPELAAAIGQVSGSMVQKSSNGETIDAADIFGGLATGILYTLNGSSGNLNRPTGTGTAPVAPAKDNTMLWVLSGLAVVAIVLILVFALRRKK